METKLTQVSSIASFAQYLHDRYPQNDYTEYSGVVFRSVELAYLISSHTRNRDEWALLSKLTDDEIRQKIAHNYPSVCTDSPRILEKILADKICGCRELRREFLSEPESAYTGAFGRHLQAIYSYVKKMDALRR